MKIWPVVMGILLLISLLFNVVALVRLKEAEAERHPAAPSSRLSQQPASSSPRAETGPAEALPYSRPAVPAAAPAPVVKSSGSVVSPVSPTSSVRSDPKVAAVLEAQDSFNAFWKDLDRVFKARSKFEEPKYLETVLATTEDYLEIPESGRAGFSQAANAAAANVALARKNYDAARKALPPKDKTNPTAYAAYQEQKAAVDTHYQEQVKAAVDGLKVTLDAGRPRHAEFASNAEKWLRNLAPRP